MKPIASVADVSRSNVLAARNEILDTARNQGTQRNLEGKTFKIDVVVATRAWMEVEMIVSDTNRVRKVFRGWLGVTRLLQRDARRFGDMLFENRELSLDAARFTDVRILRQSIFRSHNIMT